MGKKGKKGGKKGGKKAADPDAEVKEAFGVQWAALRKQIGAETAERNVFQLERDKVTQLWEDARAEADAMAAELRNKERELQEVAERQMVEKRQYQLRIKHLLFEQQNKEAKMRVDSELQVTLQHADQRGQETELSQDERELKKVLKELEASHGSVIKHMKLEFDRKETLARENFEREARELMAYYEKKMQDERGDMEAQRKREILALEKKKSVQIEQLKERNQKALRDINEYFKDVINFTMEAIKTKKAEVDGERRIEARNDKTMMDHVRENRRLNEPLSAAQREAEQLRRKLVAHDKDKDELQRVKRNLDNIMSRLSDLKWKHEIHQQKHSLLKGEHVDVSARMVDAVFDVQQQVGLERMITERKVDALEEELEKKETQLGEVLLASHRARPELEQVARKIDDVMHSKDATIAALRSELQRVARAYDDLVRMYMAKLAENGVPAQELGFVPIQMQSVVAALTGS